MSEPTLTTEQRATLQPHERHLHSALYADYVVALSTTAATALFNVYNDVYKANEVNKHCGQCVLRVCKRLGTLYFATTEPNTTTTDQLPTTDKKTPTRGKRKGSK